MRGLITAGLRIVLVLAFLNVLTDVGSNAYNLWFTHNTQDFFSSYGVLLIAFLIFLLIFWILWWKADVLAIWLSGNFSDTEIAINTSNADLIKVALRILGICLIVLALPSILGQVAYHISYMNLNGNEIPPSTIASEIRAWVIDGIQILIGLWLALGFRGTIRAMSKIWNTARMSD